MAGEQCIPFCKSNRPGKILDIATVHPYAAVGEEELEAVPVAPDIGKLFAEPGFGRDAAVLLP